jgi:hypothetical protein
MNNRSLLIFLVVMLLGCADTGFDDDARQDEQLGLSEQALSSDLLSSQQWTNMETIGQIGTGVGVQTARFNAATGCSSAGENLCDPWPWGIMPAAWATYYLPNGWQNVSWSWSRANHPRAQQQDGYEVGLCMQMHLRSNGAVASDRGCINVSNAQSGSTNFWNNTPRFGYWTGDYPVFTFRHRILPNLDYPNGSLTLAPSASSTVTSQFLRISCLGNDHVNAYAPWCGR